MISKVKEILGMTNSEEKQVKLLEQLKLIAEEQFQVREWNSKVYITASGVPIKDSFKNLEECITELNKIRETWVEYLTAHPAEARRIFGN